MQSDLWDDLIISMATSVGERQKAIEFLKDVYSGSGLLEDGGNEFFQKWRFSNEWFTSVAYLDQDIVGTCSFVLGEVSSLPSYESYDLQSHADKVWCEFSGMAVHPQYQSTQKVFLPLAIYAIQFVFRYLKVDRAIAMVHPRHVPFYCKILKFHVLDPEVVQYGPLGGALAQLISIDRETFEEFFDFEKVDALERTRFLEMVALAYAKHSNFPSLRY